MVHTKEVVHTRWKKGGLVRPQVVPDRHNSEIATLHCDAAKNDIFVLNVRATNRATDEL